MRIAIIHYTGPETVGGVEQVIHYHYCRFDGLDHSADILTAKEVPDDLSDYDVVMVHNVFTMPFDLALTHRLREMAAGWIKGKWINWVHDVAAINPCYAHLPWDDAEHQMLKQPPANCIHVAVSNVRRADYARATGLLADQIRVIPNGLDCAGVLNVQDMVRCLGEDHHLWQRDFILVHPTRLVRRKNLEFALRVVAAMRDLGQDMAYLVTGAPDPHNADHVAHAGELKRLVADLQLEDSVFFLGLKTKLDNSEVSDLYQISDLLLFPSLSEGFGLPLLEAALHGLPVYCSDIPAHREVAMEDARFFALDEDPARVVERIMKDDLVRLRRRRREVYTKHDWRVIADKHLAPLLDEAVKK